MLRRWLFGLVLLLATTCYANAQCSGSAGIPFNCAPGSAIGPSDIVLGGQGINTVKFTATQIAQFAAAAGQPGVFSTLTVTNGGSLAGSFSGNFTFSGNVTFSGAATFGGGLSLSSITLSNSTITLINTLFASLPPVTAANSGQIAFVTNCQNGSQGSGSGTGCIYAVDDTGTWVAYPSLPTQTLTIAGVAYYLGGTVTMQGVGAKVASATGSFVTGNAVTTNAAGTLIDSGVPPGGGGGGSGTVNNCATAGAPAYYAAAGTAASCPSVIDSAIWTSNASGVLTAATTLPSAQTAPTWTLSNPTVTGTMTISAATFSGALTTAASAVGGANFTLPQGTAPTSPANGNVWMVAAGMTYRANGVTVGPVIGLAQLSATAPIVDTSGVFSCPTCATTTNGGLLTATAPMAISAAGVISINEQTGAVILLFNASTPVTADSYTILWPFATGHITSVKYYTGGTSTPSYTAAISVNGTPVIGCNAISVSLASDPIASPGTTACTSTSITQYQPLTIATSSIVGSPFSSMIELLDTKSAL